MKSFNACHDALDKQGEFPRRRERRYKELEFTVGEWTIDGVGGAASLESESDLTRGNIWSIDDPGTPSRSETGTHVLIPYFLPWWTFCL